MCAIFGVLDFRGKLSPARRLALFRALANAAQIRGTDASGVAYVQNGTIKIQKAPRPASKMRWRVDPSARYLMGHTRMTTQGAASENHNNHPFPGKVGTLSFALAHNGVLHNDIELRHTRRLPATKVETDSYVAVQLLEKSGELCPGTLAQMAEALNGSFTITVLDAKNTVYLIKGNNPLTVRLFSDLGCYLYASTEDILDVALVKLGLSKLPWLDIPITQGDIMTVNASGLRSVSRFDDSQLRPQRYFFNWGPWEQVTQPSKKPDDYMDMVLGYGQRHGVPEAELRLLVDAGYDAFDIEQFIYDDEFRAGCAREIMSNFGVC